MTGFFIVLGIIAILVIIILIQMAKGKSAAKKAEEKAIAQRKQIETRDRQIAAQEFKNKKRAISKTAKQDNKIRVKKIKKTTVEYKKKIKEATTDEEIEAILTAMDTANNSRV